MTQSIRVQYGFELCRSYVAANTGTTYAVPATTLVTGTADSAYPVANLTTWNLANKFRAACVAGAMTARIDMTSSMQGSYNAVMIIEPYIPQFDPVAITATNFTDLKLYSGSSAGTITTLEDTIVAADLADGASKLSAMGSSRVWLMKISSASTLATSGAGKFLELRWTGGATQTFGASKIAIVNMVDPFATLSTPIMDSIQYNWEDRSYLNTTEGGGQSRYQKPYIRSVTLPVDMAGEITLPLASFRANVTTDLEPVMLAMDWTSDTVAGGEHTHTFPVRLNGGLSMSQRSQFSRSAFVMGSFALNYREYR